MYTVYIDPPSNFPYEMGGLEAPIKNHIHGVIL